MTTAYEVICTAIEPLLAKHGLDHKFAIKVANEAYNALEVGGWDITEDEHLAMMRAMRKMLFDRVSNPEATDRDLAAMTNRLQTVSKEVVALEEKERQEMKGKNHGNSPTGANDTTFDATEV